jgi:hypothetical protein
MYNSLKEYHSVHGDSNVPGRWSENPQLATWVSNQRVRRKKGRITEGEVRLLDSLGFVWNGSNVGTWEDRLAEVAAFKTQYGHCHIPARFVENPKLGRFANRMRVQRKKEALSDDRIARLNEIGFVWDTNPSVSSIK